MLNVVEIPHWHIWEQITEPHRVPGREGREGRDAKKKAFEKNVWPCV